MLNMNGNRFIAPALIVGLAAVIATFILAITVTNIKSNDQSITTTGSAKQVIVSDLGILRGTINVQAASPKEAYQQLQAEKPIILNYLKSKGFSEDSIEFQTSNTYANYQYNQNGQQIGISSYTTSQSISVSSTDVNKIKEVSLDISSLVEQGVNFMVNMPEYYYTKLGDIKIEIQAEAAKDAMIRGERIAVATGRKLGALRRARMGVIQITPENSNMVSDMGINDVSSIRKEITAVVNADFSIK
jgi:hypothetical protein